MVVGSEPALIEDVVRPLRELLTIVALRRRHGAARAAHPRRDAG